MQIQRKVEIQRGLEVPRDLEGQKIPDVQSNVEIQRDVVNGHTQKLQRNYRNDESMSWRNENEVVKVPEGPTRP